jgi:two-component system chemotaxis response regulator CheY
MVNAGKIILIVDDSIAIRQTVSMALRAAGFGMMQAADGKEGLAIVDANANIDLVICDINMPNMNGLEMLAQIRDKPGNEALKVLMLTTEAQTSLVKRAKELGAVGWIVKPFKSPQLVQTVEHLTRAKPTDP